MYIYMHIYIINIYMYIDAHKEHIKRKTMEEICLIYN